MLHGLAIASAIFLAALPVLLSRRAARTIAALRQVGGESGDRAGMLGHILESAPDAFVQADESGVILEWNARAAALFGWLRADAVGRRLEEIIMPDKLARFLTGARETMPGRWIEVEARRRDGRMLRVELAMTVPQDGNGRRLFNAFIRDVSGKDAAETEWRRAQRMDIIGRITGGLAYDFNNLLSVIVGNLDMLQERLVHRGPERHLAQEALDAALRGADLTRRLRAFAGQQILDSQETDVNRLIGDIMHELRRTLGEDIALTLDLEPDLWPVVIDPAQLAASLVHLAANAREAMPKGGALSVATRRLTVAGGTDDCGFVPGDYIALEVRDSGNGIATEIADRIFEPFFTTKECGRGTGLGLSVVFGFIRQSRGHIRVESEPGAGAAFRLYLPRIAEAAAGKALPCLPASRWGTETVLAVEDDAAVRRIVIRQLGDLGYRVLEAASAADALQLLNSEKVDLLFTDIVMPGDVGGVELARQAMQCWPDLKIVLTSGYPGAHGRKNGENGAGRFRHLCKPYRKDELARTLREVLAGAAGAAG